MVTISSRCLDTRASASRQPACAVEIENRRAQVATALSIERPPDDILRRSAITGSKMTSPVMPWRNFSPEGVKELGIRRCGRNFWKIWHL